MIDQILYTSDASSAMNDEEWERIQRATAIHNAVNNVTGLCCYDGKGFMQLIEGRKPKARDVMARIDRDHCHENVEIVYDRQTDFASYAQWNMRFCRLSEDSDERRADMERLVMPSLPADLKRLIESWFERGVTP